MANMNQNLWSVSYQSGNTHISRGNQGINHGVHMNVGQGGHNHTMTSGSNMTEAMSTEMNLIDLEPNKPVDFLFQQQQQQQQQTVWRSDIPPFASNTASGMQHHTQNFGTAWDNSFTTANQKGIQTTMAMQSAQSQPSSMQRHMEPNPPRAPLQNQLERWTLNIQGAFAQGGIPNVVQKSTETETPWLNHSNNIQQDSSLPTGAGYCTPGNNLPKQAWSDENLDPNHQTKVNTRPAMVQKTHVQTRETDTMATGEDTIEKQLKDKEELQHLQSRTEALERQVKALKEENNNLSYKLSAEMNNKISKDETSFENINVLNRPMKIAEDYETFFTKEWLFAKEYLDQQKQGQFQEEQAVNFLFQLILMTEEGACNVQMLVQEKIYEVLRQPIEGGPQNPRKPTVPTAGKSQVTLSLALQNAVGDHLRSLSSDVIVTKIKEAAHNAMLKKSTASTKFLHAQPMQRYLEALASISWKMVNQRPNLTFQWQGCGEKFNEKNQIVHWGSDDPSLPRSRVQQYVRPAMYHGSHVMAKAVVIVKLA